MISRNWPSSKPKRSGDALMPGAEAPRICHDFAAVPGSHVRGKRGVAKAVTVFSDRYQYVVETPAGSLALLRRSM